jgi:hypothetical protein
MAARSRHWQEATVRSGRSRKPEAGTDKSTADDQDTREAGPKHRLEARPSRAKHVGARHVGAKHVGAKHVERGGQAPRARHGGRDGDQAQGPEAQGPGKRARLAGEEDNRRAVGGLLGKLYWANCSGDSGPQRRRRRLSMRRSGAMGSLPAALAM